MCETPTGLLNLPAIAQRGLERNDAMDLQAVIFGGDDYAAEAGATRSSGNAELMMARQTVVAVCRAYGLQPLDIVNINISSDAEAALRAEAAQGKAWGFAGKQIIHRLKSILSKRRFRHQQQRLKLRASFLRRTRRTMNRVTAAAEGVLIQREDD